MEERVNQGSPESARAFYRERIIEMVKEIHDEKFLKMAYGFVKRLSGKKDNEQRTAEYRKSTMNR